MTFDNPAFDLRRTRRWMIWNDRDDGIRRASPARPATRDVEAKHERRPRCRMPKCRMTARIESLHHGDADQQDCLTERYGRRSLEEIRRHKWRRMDGSDLRCSRAACRSTWRSTARPKRLFGSGAKSSTIQRTGQLDLSCAFQLPRRKLWQP